jgi:peptidyl-prolyl cis-trans isomerase SurA
MTLTRLLSVILAAALGTTAFAQTNPNPDTTALTEKLNQRYANGVVAAEDGTLITVTDLVRYVGPLLAGLRQHTRDEPEFQEKVDRLVESAVRSMKERAALIREFRSDGVRSIPEEYVDNAIAEELAQRFAGDRSKFLEHLRQQSKTLRDYRREVEENIIFQYMRGQQRNAAQADREAKREKNSAPAEADTEPRVHLRLIELTRADAETDATLKTRADKVVSRFKAGEKFADLATELSQDSRRTRGGDWGWQKRHDFKKEFADIAFGLKKGETSAPILLPEGAFILYVEDRK